MTKIGLHGKISVGPYKGYMGRAEYEEDDRAFHGTVVGTRAVIYFTGATPTEVSQAFKDSVDDYLAFCAADGDKPEKPFSGKFLVRIKSETHRELVKLADHAGESLNQFVSDFLDGAVRQVTSKRRPHAAQATGSRSINEKPNQRVKANRKQIKRSAKPATSRVAKRRS